MGGHPGATITGYTPELADRLRAFVTSAATQPDVRAAVEANHDDNRWWPAYVQDWRIRMAVAGWSSRVSYAMVGTYAGVVARADTLGWDMLTTLDDESLARLVRPIGLPVSTNPLPAITGPFHRPGRRTGNRSGHRTAR